MSVENALTDGEMACPCGNGALQDCCGPYLDGRLDAPTAEKLMRSRYTAYALGNVEYLLRSWHPASRPEDFVLEEAIRWQGLDILDTAAGGEGDETGEVEFVARYMVENRPGQLRERSDFRREDGLWYYVDGVEVKAQPVSVTKIGRNEPCPCGSGKKYKRCCYGS